MKFEEYGTIRRYFTKFPSFSYKKFGNHNIFSFFQSPRNFGFYHTFFFRLSESKNVLIGFNVYVCVMLTM